jgi:hypothetical protein
MNNNYRWESNRNAGYYQNVNNIPSFQPGQIPYVQQNPI